MDAIGGRVRSVVAAARYVPVTVLAVAAVSGVIAAEGVAFTDVFAVGGLWTLVNPFVYTANALFHAGGWSHYAHNVALWVPFGILLTLLTSNRHVLLIAVVANALTVAVALPIEGLGLGLSHVVFAVAAATLVRATGIAMQNGSQAALQLGIAAVFVPCLLGFLLVMVLAGPRWIADFYHFLGFLFGGAIEAVYVLGERDGASDERSIPRGVGR